MRPTRPTHHYLPCPRFPLPLQDSKLKTWAWENDVLCAYKDDQLQPIPITKARTRVDWADAQTCTGAPNATTSARDKLNRLWGWERQRCARARAGGGKGLPWACHAPALPACTACCLLAWHTCILLTSAPPPTSTQPASNCAFKDDAGNPLYYPAYVGPRYEPPGRQPSPSPSPLPAPTPPPVPEAPPKPATSPAPAVSPEPPVAPPAASPTPTSPAPTPEASPAPPASPETAPPKPEAPAAPEAPEPPPACAPAPREDALPTKEDLADAISDAIMRKMIDATKCARAPPPPRRRRRCLLECVRLTLPWPRLRAKFARPSP